jgi:hypothetical protein
VKDHDEYNVQIREDIVVTAATGTSIATTVTSLSQKIPREVCKQNATMQIKPVSKLCSRGASNSGYNSLYCKEKQGGAKAKENRV